MNTTWLLRIYDGHQLVGEHEVDGPVEVGRQSEGEDAPYALSQADSGTWRLVVARLDENTVPRKHARVEPLPPGRARVVSLSKRIAVLLHESGPLEPEGAREVGLPLLLVAGRTTVRIEPAADGPVVLESLEEATRAPGSASGARLSTLRLDATDGVRAEDMVKWLRDAMEVLHSAAGSPDFFARAARAVVDLADLDAAGVVLLEGGNWQKPQAVEAGPRGAPEADWRPSQRLLERLRCEKRTFWEVPGAGQAGSLLGVRGAVAVPILDRRGEVVGALYGDRRYNLGQTPITRLQAMLVELLAGGVAAGLARLEQEQAAARARVRFEQFFTRELSQQLTLRPDMLEGREEEVTVLFCDIRGFSRMTQNAGAAMTMEWLRQVLGALSECVLDSGGVLIDYVGDELMAMWGAPARQEDHARRACGAALRMLERLPALDARWQPSLGEPLRLGIGINSGPAQVGDVGTDRKFKYGALGNTVNLASRVQGATKLLKTRVLITEATHAKLDATFARRRVRSVRVVNIRGPVSLYELAPPGDERWAGMKGDYEKALDDFEKRQFRAAARALAPLVSEPFNDGPSLVLLAQAVRHMVEEPEKFDPAWELPGK